MPRPLRLQVGQAAGSTAGPDRRAPGSAAPMSDGAMAGSIRLQTNLYSNLNRPNWARPCSSFRLRSGGTPASLEWNERPFWHRKRSPQSSTRRSHEAVCPRRRDQIIKDANRAVAVTAEVGVRMALILQHLELPTDGERTPSRPGVITSMGGVCLDAIRLTLGPASTFSTRAIHHPKSRKTKSRFSDENRLQIGAQGGTRTPMRLSTGF